MRAESIKNCLQCGGALTIIQNSSHSKVNVWSCGNCNVFFRRVVALEKLTTQQVIEFLKPKNITDGKQAGVQNES